MSLWWWWLGLVIAGLVLAFITVLRALNPMSLCEAVRIWTRPCSEAPPTLTRS